MHVDKQEIARNEKCNPALWLSLTGNSSFSTSTMTSTREPWRWKELKVEKNTSLWSSTSPAIQGSLNERGEERKLWEGDKRNSLVSMRVQNQDQVDSHSRFNEGPH